MHQKCAQRLPMKPETSFTFLCAVVLCLKDVFAHAHNHTRCCTYHVMDDTPHIGMGNFCTTVFWSSSLHVYVSFLVSLGVFGCVSEAFIFSVGTWHHCGVIYAYISVYLWQWFSVWALYFTAARSFVFRSKFEK